MKPITYFFDSIDRLAISIKPRQPFKDWALSIPPLVDCDFTDNNIYLVGNLASVENLQEWLKNNFEEIFENELNEWIQDEKYWPADCSFELFTEWFEVDYFTLVYDVEKRPIQK